MESELLTDKESDLPPVPLKTYQWEDLRRAREAGGYPWTHFLKPPLEGEITAEDIIRATTPRRSMSREFSKSRTHSPTDGEPQRILNLDSSPGSSRKHGEEGVDEGVHIPNFSKEVSLDSEDDPLRSVNTSVNKNSESQMSSHLVTPVEIPKNISPKSILKRRAHEQQYNIGVIETREKTKCCHPLVNKIKHLADKTLHKLERNDYEKSPLSKRKKNEELQEIRQLKSSPGAVRRQKFSAIKLGDSDEMSKTMSIDTPPQRKKTEHIYEDIEGSKCQDDEKFSLRDQDYNEREIEKNNMNKESDNLEEKKSNTSKDPSLIVEDINNLDGYEHIMDKLHKKSERNKEAKVLDDMDSEEPNVDEIFQEQLEGNRPANDSPNITITEITEDNLENNIEQSNTLPIESSPSPSPREFQNERNDVEIIDNDWSKPSSDHEYEIIEKPPPNIVYTAPSIEEKPTMVKTDDELSSTTSIERKYLQHTSDEDEQTDDKDNDDKNEDILNAETLQKDIEERFFVNTPSTASRTECEISTSQVDSSALEKLPLQRSNRPKNSDSADKRIHQRIKEGTGKLKSQAGKLKSKIQNMKTKQFTMPNRPKFNLPERPKFKMPDRPKLNFPERPKFTLPDRRKFSLPERSRFKNFSFTERFTNGDRKKFSFPNRPKFNIPDLSKIKMPERPKINFSSLGRKKEYKVETDVTESSSDIQNVATVDFEARTYPRLFNRKKKTELPKTSSSPTLNRDDTPPPTFTFTRVKKSKEEPSYIPDSPEHPREYGDINNENGYEERYGRKQFETTYDFDKLSPEFMDEDIESSSLKESRNAASIPDMSLSKQEYTHINEINNDEFFVRPRGISRENIEVREYLSDEIRQAFNIPKNVLATMGSSTEVHDEHLYANEPEADSELMLNENDPIHYSNEDVNDGDDGYYTFPPVRPSRAKRKKKEIESIKYIDDSVNASMQFSDVDLGLPEDQIEEQPLGIINIPDENVTNANYHSEFEPTAELHSIHEYCNDDVNEYPENIPVQSQTLPMPPKRKKKFGKKDLKHSSLNDFKSITSTELWDEPQEQTDDIIVYRTEHEYIVPHTRAVIREQSPVAPRRTRSRSSRGTSLCDDDRTSHGAESLILDTNLPPVDDTDIVRETRQESPGYATVDKGSYAPKKGARRSKSKTPPVRRRKSNSSERKYYTVGANKGAMPSRPARKKSSTSLRTLDSFTKRSVSGDITQYIEIIEPQFEEVHRDLVSGEVLKKMKDRPLPPPPRPPRGPKRKKKFSEEPLQSIFTDIISTESIPRYTPETMTTEDVVEIEVSTQTDPLPEDVDFEFGLDENLDISMSSSLRDIIDEESMVGRSRRKISESPRFSRTTSRSEKSLKLSDPKISELSKLNIDRSSPTVILVERRVSSPTKINEREEMLTEASLTVQHIDIEKSKVPEVPPLPKSKGVKTTTADSINIISPSEEQALETITERCKDVQLDNLVTQRLQVKDLDVGRLNVSELQANKILVSDIEGMTLRVNELDSKSSHISVSGIEFSQTVIDEIAKKFAEISTNNVAVIPPSQEVITLPRSVSREEHTQTEEVQIEDNKSVLKTDITTVNESEEAPPPPPRPTSHDEFTLPPQRPPLPDLSPLLYSYLQDLTLPTSTITPRQLRERPFSDFHESQLNLTPPPPARRAKRKPAAPQASDSSSGEARPRPSPRRMPPPVKPHEPTVTETGAQFLRACQNSITRTIRSIFNSFMSYIHGHEDKKDIQMALVIFLVLIAGLIMFGLSESRTVHHHHWEFFNPPDGKQ